VFNPIPIEGYSGVDAGVWEIQELEPGRLLLLMGNSELLEYNGSAFRIFDPGLPDKDAYITTVLKDGDNLWIGSDEGLYLLNNGSIGRVSGLPGVIIQHLYRHSSGDIWVATNTGAARIRSEETSTYILAGGLGHYNVNVIAEDLRGEVWLGTSAGFTRVIENEQTGIVEFQNFGRETGMKLVETMFLYFDNEGFLWHGTNGGIHRFDLNEFYASGQMEAEHLRLSRLGFGVETMVAGSMKIDNDRVWFATMEGIVIVDTRKYAARGQGENTVLIESIILDGEAVDWAKFGEQLSVHNGIYSFPEVRFPSGTGSIRFEFSGLEFLNPDNQHFQYRLVGFENDWNQSQGQNWASYRNLNPGTYSFVVMSRTGNGPWSKPVTYNFSIAVPFWQAPWFWFLSIIAAGFLLVTIFNYQVRKADHKRLKILVDEQTRDIQKALDERTILLKEVHHRVKNNLSIINGLLEIQMDSIDDERLVSAFNESQLRIMSIALVHEKLYQNENLSRIGIHQYIPDLLEVASKSMKKPGTDIQLYLNLADIELSLEQAIPCGLIMNELISNVHKHAFNGRKSGEVHVDLFRQNGHCIFRMQDNGVGLPAGFDMNSTDSIGLILVNALIAQLKGEMCYRNDNGAVFEMKFKPDLTSSF
jgi:two-component sensor histidine kinase